MVKLELENGTEPKYIGSCHCGDVTFSITSLIQELTTCDCSLCTQKNALMAKVHESDFKLIAGEHSLTEYRWNMQIAQHYFCKKCGIYTFHRKRARPDYFGINIYCLQNFDPTNVTIRPTDGITMSVNPKTARDDWIGPRVDSS